MHTDIGENCALLLMELAIFAGRHLQVSAKETIKTSWGAWTSGKTDQYPITSKKFPITKLTTTTTTTSKANGALNRKRF
jgi:hypothetical protein